MGSVQQPAQLSPNKSRRLSIPPRSEPCAAVSDDGDRPARIRRPAAHRQHDRTSRRARAPKIPAKQTHMASMQALGPTMF
jgi:hypothetical protein